MNATCMHHPIAALALLAIAGCCKHGIELHPKLTPSSSEIFHQAARTGPTGILFIADTHASNPLAPHRAISDGTAVGEHLTHVAVRPPHMDVWGWSVVSWVLAHNSDASLIVHLGDAANIGCTNELDRFLAAMQAQPRPWVMAPGNHDTLFLGNFSIEGFEGSKWATECHNRDDIRDEHMDKNELIRRYLEAQHWGPLDAAKECTQLARTETATTYPALERIAACVYPDAPHASFLVQQVAVSAALTLVVIDTSVHDTPRGLFAQGGTKGGLGVQQPALLDQWISEEAGRAQPRAILVAGHFALDHLDKQSRVAFNKLVSTHALLGYVSAHEHDPTKQLLHPDPTDQRRGFPELNIASLIDWPMEYVRASFDQANDRMRMTFDVMSASLQLDSAPGSECNAARSLHGTDPKDVWFVDHDKGEKYDTYTSYVPSRWRSIAFWLGNGAWKQLRDRMYLRMQRILGLSDADLEDLEQRELHGALPHKDPLFARYERCQVRWASEEEGLTIQGVLGHEIHWDAPTIENPVRDDSPSSAVIWTWQR